MKVAGTPELDEIFDDLAGIDIDVVVGSGVDDGGGGGGDVF